jgi:TPR repeat protein
VAAGSIAELETLTARDDPGALLELASRYQQGRGVPRDLPRAAGLYERAAKLGNAEAQYNLGNLYLLGEGLPQDDDWAFTWYRAAARQGHALAQKNVAEFYRAAGMQPPTDDTAGTPALLSPAQSAGTAANGKADDDDDVAPSNLPNAPVPVPAEVSADEMSAMELARSRGIQIDAAPAPAYPPVIEPAVPVGPTASAAMPNERDPQLEPARLALAAGKAPSALPLLEGKAAEGNAEAQWLLAQVLYSMKRNAEDQNNALLWLQRAATAGWRDAQFALGQRYDRGEGVVADEAEAVTWYRAAARQGHAAALERLQAIYRNAGLPVPPLEPVQVPATPSASLNGRDLPCTRIDCSPPTV